MNSFRRLALAIIPAAFLFAACGSDTADEAATRDAGSADSALVTQPGTGTSPVDTAVSSAEPTSVAKINLNTATDEQLRTVPGVGDKMVHEFEEYRPYRSIVQFRKEIGKYVDGEKVAEYEKYLFVPIDINESDMETVAQIPGIDMSEANQIVTGRPYATPDAFFARVSEFTTPESVEIARGLIATK